MWQAGLTLGEKGSVLETKDANGVETIKIGKTAESTKDLNVGSQHAFLWAWLKETRTDFEPDTIPNFIPLFFENFSFFCVTMSLNLRTTSRFNPSMSKMNFTQ